MKPMKWKLLAMVLAPLCTLTFFAAGFVPAAGAQESEASKVGVVTSEELGKVSKQVNTQVIATVEAVDRDTRSVTLKGPEGNLVTVMVGDDVRNFDQIDVGDNVEVRYSLGVVLQLVKGGGGVRTRVENENASRAAKGEKPAGTSVREVLVVADVLSVDRERGTVTLQGPNRVVELQVRNREQLENIEVGDQVEATFTEAVAISVKEAPVKE